MRIELHPGAERDLAEAAEFYGHEGSPALAARFIAEFKRVSNMLASVLPHERMLPVGLLSFRLFL
jgi:plasmid stabilization system protein ParE